MNKPKNCFVRTAVFNEGGLHYARRSTDRHPEMWTEVIEKSAYDIVVTALKKIAKCESNAPGDVVDIARWALVEAETPLFHFVADEAVPPGTVIAKDKTGKEIGRIENIAADSTRNVHASPEKSHE